MSAPGAIALIAPPLSALVGFGVGAGHPGDLYSYSLLLTTLLAAIGGLGASFGLGALVGFVFGDILLARVDSSALPITADADGLRAVAALVLSYIVLAGLLVLVPVVANVGRLAVSARLSRRDWGPALGSGSLGVIAVGLAFCWTQSTPFLIRPVWSYFSRPPDVRAIAPLQQRGWLLALTVAFAVSTRLVLERRASRRMPDLGGPDLGWRRPTPWPVTVVGAPCLSCLCCLVCLSPGSVPA